MFLAFEERKQLIEEKQRLSAYLNGLKSILKRNPYLDAKVGLGYDNFLDFTSVSYTHLTLPTKA